jgi:hypothetical protein
MLRPAISQPYLRGARKFTLLQFSDEMGRVKRTRGLASRETGKAVES